MSESCDKKEKEKNSDSFYPYMLMLDNISYDKGLYVKCGLFTKCRKLKSEG